MTIQDFFREHPKIALAFSGGVDSAYLLYAARACGADVRPYCAFTPFQPAFEREEAEDFCRLLGTALYAIEVPLLESDAVAANPADRCYHCKQLLLNAIMERAGTDGYGLLMDGTNASDDASDRPGMRALREAGVLSPLRLCGLTKDEIRRLSHEAGLPTWDKPAYACLATRIPTGERITPELLGRVEGAEAALRALGYSDLRVRVFHGAARIQLPKAQLMEASRNAAAIQSAIKPYFDIVMLDLEGR